MATPRNPILVTVDSTFYEWQQETNATTNIVNYFIRSSDGVFVADSAELTNVTISGGTFTNISIANSSITDVGSTYSGVTFNDGTINNSEIYNAFIANPTVSGTWNFTEATLNIKSGNETERLAKGYGNPVEFFYNFSDNLLYVFDGTVIGGRAFSPTAGETVPNADQITIADVANRYDALNVEEALAEIAGAGRLTTETVASNADDIITLESDKVDKTTLITAGSGLTGGGNLSNNILIEHLNTSSITNVTDQGADGVAITGMEFDTFGHATARSTYDFDGRYYTETEISSTVSGAPGANLVGTYNTNLNFAAIQTAADVQASIAAIDEELLNITTGDLNNLYYTETELSDSTITPGAALIGTYAAAFAKSAGTDVQTVLDDFDAAIVALENTDITLTLDGDVSGSATFTDLSSATLTVTVANDSHTHDTRYYTETELGLPGTSRMTSGAYKIGTFDEFSNSASTNVQDVLDDLDSAIATLQATDIVVTLTGAVTGTGTITDLGDVSIATSVNHNHDSRYYTETELGAPGSGNTTSGAYKIGTFDEFAKTNSTNVQDVLDDLDQAIVNIEGRSITAGTALTGGGTLAASRTINHADVSSTMSTDVSSDGTAITGVTVNAQGHVTNVASYDFDSRYFAETELVDSDSTPGAALIGTYAAAFANSASTNVQGVLDNLDQEITNIKGTDITLTLGGDLSGSATFTNLGSATLTAVVANDSHTHDTRYYTEAESDARFINATGDIVQGTNVRVPTAQPASLVNGDIWVT